MDDELNFEVSSPEEMDESTTVEMAESIDKLKLDSAKSWATIVEDSQLVNPPNAAPHETTAAPPAMTPPTPAPIVVYSTLGRCNNSRCLCYMETMRRAHVLGAVALSYSDRKPFKFTVMNALDKMTLFNFNLMLPAVHRLGITELYVCGEHQQQFIRPYLPNVQVLIKPVPKAQRPCPCHGRYGCSEHKCERLMKLVYTLHPYNMDTLSPENVYH